MNKKKFIKKKENFTCENCDTFVEGTGYTNHCPVCLWSMHVDVNPGDRSSDCRGMMRPVGAVSYGQTYIILHECSICGHKKRNKTAPEDNVDVIILLSTKPLKN